MLLITSIYPEETQKN